MWTTSEIKFIWHLTFTLSVGLQTILTFDVENQMCWTCECERCTCLFINTLKMIKQRITNLILLRHRNYLQFFTFWIFCNRTESRLCLKVYWTNSIFFVSYSIEDFELNTKIFSWFCQCVFILWGILWTASSSECPIGYYIFIVKVDFEK